jgi:hypothetical protein
MYPIQTCLYGACMCMYLFAHTHKIKQLLCCLYVPKNTYVSHFPMNSILFVLSLHDVCIYGTDTCILSVSCLYLVSIIPEFCAGFCAAADGFCTGFCAGFASPSARLHRSYIAFSPLSHRRRIVASHRRRIASLHEMQGTSLKLHSPVVQPTRCTLTEDADPEQRVLGEASMRSMRTYVDSEVMVESL